MNGAYRLILLPVGAGNACDTQAIVRPQALTRSLGHSSRCLLTDDSIVVYNLTWHSQLHLEFSAVGDQASYEIVGTIRDISKSTGKQPARERFHDGQCSPALGEIFTDHTLQRILIDTEDVMPENLACSILHLCHLSLSYLARFSLCCNAYINRVRLGVSGQGRIVAMNQPIQPLFNGGLSQAPDTQDARKDQSSCVGAEPRDGLLLPHAVHFSRYARHSYDDMPIFLNPPARSSPEWIGYCLRRGNQGRLLDITLGHDSIALIDSRARSSSVGPRPPVMITRLDRSQARCSVSTIRPWLSPTCETK